MKRKIEVGEFFLRKKCRSVVRQVMRDLTQPGSRRLLQVYEYFSASGSQVHDAVWEDRLWVWGEPITEEQARRLIPNLDERRALLDAELQESGRQLWQSISAALLVCPPAAANVSTASSEKSRQFADLCAEAQNKGIEGVAVASVEELGDTYEEVTCNLRVLARYGLSLRVLLPNRPAS